MTALGVMCAALSVAAAIAAVWLLFVVDRTLLGLFMGLVSLWLSGGARYALSALTKEQE